MLKVANQPIDLQLSTNNFNYNSIGTSINNTSALAEFALKLILSVSQTPIPSLRLKVCPLMVTSPLITKA